MRITINIPKREDYKAFPMAQHLSLLSRLQDTHGFTLTKFLRKRDNYVHKFDYDLRLEKIVGPVKYELQISHDGYFTLDVFEKNDEIQRWLSCTSNVVRVPDKLKIEVVTHVTE